jgi:hypothetical protein
MLAEKYPEQRGPREGRVKESLDSSITSTFTRSTGAEHGHSPCHGHHGKGNPAQLTHTRGPNLWLQVL